MENAPLTQRFQQQRNAFKLDGFPTLSQRLQALENLEKALLAQQNELITALQADFGQRSTQEIQIAEFFPSLSALRFTQKHLKNWLKPEKRRASKWFASVAAQVVYQPLGVVGIISPWNYPVSLTITPLVSALAAGNRVMVKLSEHTPHTAEVLQKVLATAFHANEVHAVVGDIELGKAFSALPFDHLLFTGSTATGQQVMQAASANLTPVTLELGGKSPVIIAEEVDWDMVVEQVLMGKLFNAGQTCVAPDYILLPAGQEARFIEKAREVMAKRYPNFKDNTDYTSIINDAHYERLQKLLNETEQRGAEVTHLVAQDDIPLAKTRRFPPAIILNPKPDHAIYHEEIFGPLLLVIPYQQLDDAIAYINARPRPLSAYYFGSDKQAIQKVIEEVICGGMTINDVMLHVAQNDLPFGGVGASGMGRYHGFDGFVTFSNRKAVLQQKPKNRLNWLYPPYGGLRAKLVIKQMLKR